jgi:hypothetical protein
MPQIATSYLALTVSAVNKSRLTVTSTTGIWVGMVGNLVGPGGTPVATRVQVTSVESSTVFAVKSLPENQNYPNFISYPAFGGNNTGGDFTSWATGTIYFEPQLADVTDLANVTLPQNFSG